MKKKKIKTGGRKKLYTEETGTVAFRLPLSKIDEIKAHVLKQQLKWKR